MIKKNRIEIIQHAFFTEYNVRKKHAMILRWSGLNTGRVAWNAPYSLSLNFEHACRFGPLDTSSSKRPNNIIVYMNFSVWNSEKILPKLDEKVCETLFGLADVESDNCQRSW